MVELESVSLFRDLPGREMSMLRRLVREKRVAAGQEIFKQGDDGDGMYVVRSGLVEISGVVGENVRLVFSQFGPGEIFGEMSLIENKPRSANATAAKETVVWFTPRAEMLKLIEQSPALSLALLREISKRLRTFNQHYLNEAVQAERLAVIGRFTNSIVHDLKNPLAVIGMASELLNMEQASPEARLRAVKRIHDQAERINDLITDVLDFTRGSAVTLKLDPVNYGGFVRETLEELRSEAEAKSIKLVLENEPPAGDLQLNIKRLRRVFFNLVNNATDVIPNGGNIVFRFIPGNGELVTEIEDSGPGIAPEIADKLFKAFATFGKAHGTGLGLSICKKIIEDHHGRIWARNEPGRGAVFAFALPV